MYVSMLTWLRRLGCRYYIDGPCNFVVYAPAQSYLTVRAWGEYAREIGTCVTVLIDEL